jgi:hypothetical protein
MIISKKKKKKPRYYKGNRKCFHCKGKPIRTTTAGTQYTIPLKSEHINVAQPVPKKYFCDNICKLEWIYKVQAKGGKV